MAVFLQLSQIANSGEYHFFSQSDRDALIEKKSGVK